MYLSAGSHEINKPAGLHYGPLNNNFVSIGLSPPPPLSLSLGASDDVALFNLLLNYRRPLGGGSIVVSGLLRVSAGLICPLLLPPSFFLREESNQ